MFNIAIVDDEQDILTILDRFLNGTSEFNISTFSNPIEGLSAVQNGNYDLVLLDIMMPQLDGLEFLKTLKDTNPDIKVIIMTAYDTLERSLKAHKYGAKNFINKPFKSLDMVKEKIEKELR